MTTRRNRRLRISRDSVLFAVGLLGIANETLLQGGERPTLLVLFAAMVGLPAFLATDERRRKDDDPPDHEPPPPPAPGQPSVNAQTEKVKEGDA